MEEASLPAISPLAFFPVRMTL